MQTNTNKYTEILKDTAQMLYLARANSANADQLLVAELYGIYYNAFAGCMRSGIIYSKEMDRDGYPKYVISVGNNTYPCKDIALRDILAEDYERITKYPYKDTSFSFVQHYLPEKKDGKDEYKDDTKQPEDIISESNLMGQEESILRAKNRELLKDARGFQYDPDYDHYYSDRLPEILKELDSSRRVIAARAVCMSLSVICILTAMLFL